MWDVSGTTIKMVVGEYGVDLHLTVNGVTLTAADSPNVNLKIRFYMRSDI